MTPETILPNSAPSGAINFDSLLDSFSPASDTSTPGAGEQRDASLPPAVADDSAAGGSDLGAFLATPEGGGGTAPVPAAAPTPTPTPGWDPDAWLSKVIPDPSRFSGEASTAFAELRETLKRAAEENRNLAIQASSVAPPEELRRKIEAEVTSKYADYDVLKAQTALWNNEAFIGEFQAEISRVSTEQKEILRKIGAKEALADLAAEHEGEYEQAKFWRDNVEDRVARDLLTQKGMVVASKMREMKGKMRSPLDHIKTYAAAAEQQRVQASQQGSQRNAARALAIHQQVALNVAAENPIYRTPYGQGLLNELSREYATNALVSEEQIVRERIAARSVPALTKYVGHLEAQLQDARGKLSRYQGVQPNPNVGGAPSGQGGGNHRGPTALGLEQHLDITRSAGLFKSL